MNTQQLFQNAQRCHQQGQLAEAEQLYRELLAQAPHFAEGRHLLGLACSQQGRHEEGAHWLLQAIEANMTHPPYYNNLGLIYGRMGQWEAAMQAYQAALRLAPKFTEACFNLGNAAKQLGDTAKAIKYFEKTLKLDPRHVRAMYNLGNALLDIGKPKSAQARYEQAIALRPDYPEAHNNLGSALEAWDEHERALEHYAKAIALRPDFADALKNLAHAQARQGDSAEAKRLIERHLALLPDPDWAALKLAGIAPIVAEDAAHIAAFQAQLSAALATCAASAAALDLATLHEQGLEPPAQLPYQGLPIEGLLRQYGQAFAARLPHIARPSAPRRKARPRVGFVVTDGHEGVFMKCMRGIVNHFDHSRFEVVVVCSLPHGEAKLRPALSHPALRFLGLPKRIDHAADLLAKADFDILHYWEVGTDALNYFLPFFRCAPVQCATWGWPTSTGIPTMDYFLSCALLEPEGAEAHYSERLVRFQKLPSYYYRPPVPELPETRQALGLPEGVPIYLCAQNLRKVHPDFDALVRQILEADPQGEVCFIEDSRRGVTARLRARLAEACGPHAGRIRFLPRMAETRYLSLLTRVDVILDTLYYTGGANTAYDAFAAGTPYVTLPWHYHRGKFGEAAYRQIGITEAIASDAADYVAKALRIAQDPAYRQALSARIRAQAGFVFEDRAAVKELEDFFWQVWQGAAERDA